MIRSSSKFYRNLSAILSLCLLLLIIPGGVLAVEDPVKQYFAGSGTEADPYQISDVDDLSYMVDAMNYEVYSGAHYVLTQDIDLKDELSIDAVFDRNYRTISTFSGVFDGQGFAIQNMSFDASDIKSTDDVDIMGSAGTSLIDYLQEGSLIKNLKIENVDISAPDYNASVLVNSIGTGASVHNVTISGNVIGDYASGVAFSNDGLISNSVMIGSVSADNAAGIVYRNFGSIKDCTNLSNVDGLRAGGISADNRGQISGCTNEGNVTAYEAGGITAGSLSFISYRSISPSDDDTAERSTIVNCGNSGVVQGNIAGGIAAMMYYSEIHNSYNTGEIIYDDIDITSLSDVSLSGASYGAIGGLVAETGSYLKFSVEDTGILLTNSYNAGVLTSESDDAVIGSLIGRHHVPVSLNNCYYLESGFNAVGSEVFPSVFVPNTVVGTLATFDNNGGDLTPLEGHEVIGGETKLINALNTWVRGQESADFKYWGALADVNSGYPDFIAQAVVSFNANGGNTDGSNMVKRPGLTYGQNETGVAVALPTAAREGYTFAGWYNSVENAANTGNSGLITDDSIVVNSEAHTLYAGWTPRNDIVYKVEHYLQKAAGGSDYELKETKTYQGTTATTVNAVVANYSGYKEKSSYSGRLASGIVVADGSLVLKLYYDIVPTTINYRPQDTSTGIQVDNLDSLIKINDEDKDDSQEVTVYLKVEDLQENTIAPQTKAKAEAELSGLGHELLDVFDISVFKRIVRNDSSVWEGKVPNEDLLGMITVRIPVPQQHQGKDNLAIAFVDDEGNIELYETKMVTIEGVEYLEFSTDHFSMYAIVQRDAIPLADDELTKTGETESRTAVLLLITAGIALVLGKKRYYRHGRG